MADQPCGLWGPPTVLSKPRFPCLRTRSKSACAGGWRMDGPPRVTYRLFQAQHSLLIGAGGLHSRR